ncbi:MAG: hypothetical protein DRR03_01905 [Gammaproteobacteria bacterium]|nr:MAG: hypothetical protein DRR03_01905 [Gammaproteobacteria bacterium]
MSLRYQTIVLLLSLIPGLGQACGWWGDGESSSAVSTMSVTASGQVVATEIDPMTDPELMIHLGDSFRTGSGPARDHNLARHWYRLAAERGHPGGQYNLAQMYELGLGVRRDTIEAAFWYRRAAEQGEVHSQHHLAAMYRDGRGVSRDPQLSLAWFEAAARQGHGEVFPELAMAYQQGQGVNTDLRRAYLWWWLAAESGDPEAIRQVAGLRQQMTVLVTGQVEAEGRALRAGWRRVDEVPGS